MTNTLDLNPDWDLIGLMKEVEKAYGIRIRGEETEVLSTVGDLYKFMGRHIPHWDEHKG